jgi:hypothetical protein
MAGKTGMLGYAVALAAALAAPAGALTVPFTEDFVGNASGWVNNASGALTWNATGGPDGGSYVSTTLASISGNGTIQFRANDGFDASGDAFVGNWIGTVTSISAQVFHDAPEPIDFFFRFAGAGAMVGFLGAVAPNTWTPVSIAIDPATLTPAGGSYLTTMSNVINLQVGVSVPLEYEGVPFTYGLDEVAIGPEPGTGALLAGALIALGAVRRRR